MFVKQSAGNHCVEGECSAGLNLLHNLTSIITVVGLHSTEKESGLSEKKRSSYGRLPLTTNPLPTYVEMFPTRSQYLPIKILSSQYLGYVQ